MLTIGIVILAICLVFGSAFVLLRKVKQRKVQEVFGKEGLRVW